MFEVEVRTAVQVSSCKSQHRPYSAQWNIICILCSKLWRKPEKKSIASTEIKHLQATRSRKKHRTKVDEWKTNLMSLATLFHLLCCQHVSDINISIFRSLRLCSWITTSVALFSVRCVLELLVRLALGGVRFAGWSTGFSLQNEHHQISAAAKTPTHKELRTRRPMW